MIKTYMQKSWLFKIYDQDKGHAHESSLKKITLSSDCLNLLTIL